MSHNSLRPILESVARRMVRREGPLGLRGTLLSLDGKILFPIGYSRGEASTLAKAKDTNILAVSLIDPSLPNEPRRVLENFNIEKDDVHALVLLETEQGGLTQIWTGLRLMNASGATERTAETSGRLSATL